MPLMEAAMRSHGRDLEAKDREIRELRRCGTVLVEYLKKLSAGADLKPHELRPISAVIQGFTVTNLRPNRSE